MTTTLDNRQGILDERDRGAVHVTNVPYYYEVHLGMPCNEKCIMCVPDGKHKQDQISFEDFVTFFERIKPYAQQLTLLGGETFMYPRFNDVLDLLAQHPVTVTIITNATMLTEKVTPRLLALHGLDLRLSIDASTRDTYHKIRGRDLYENVVRNIRRFTEVSRDLPRIKRIPVFVVMRRNLHEVLPFIDFALSIDAYRVDFQPVKHVSKWKVENGTGWLFDGSKQSVESFRDEYNDVMAQAKAKCEQYGLRHDILFI